MTVLLVAHGTRHTRGVAMIGDITAATSARLGETVAVSFVDVLGPRPAEALSTLDGSQVAVVPAFLTRGYHVRVDLPAQLRDFPNAVVTPALCHGNGIVEALADRLRQAGYRAGDAVVLAAAGSSDPLAHSDIRRTGRLLADRIGAPVRIGFAGAPHGEFASVPDVVAELRSGGARRVAIASYLLADGLFARRLHATGADVVAEPLGLHPAVIEALCELATSPVGRGLIAGFNAGGPGFPSAPRPLASLPSTPPSLAEPPGSQSMASR